MSEGFRMGLSSFALAAAFCVATAAEAACPPLPHTITNGQVADATKVMDDLEALRNCAGAGGATNSVQINTGSGTQGGVGPLTDGQIIVGSTGSPPQAATITAGSGIAISSGPGSLSISATGSGGGDTLLETKVASNSAYLDFTDSISSSFDNYIVEITDLVLTDNSIQLRIIFSSDDGATWDQSSIYDSAIWQTNQNAFSANVGSANAGYGKIVHDYSNASSSSINGRIEIFKPSSANFKQSTFHYSNFASDGNFYNLVGSIRYKSTNAVNAFRILPSSGNIYSGTIRVYGVQK